VAHVRFNVPMNILGMYIQFIMIGEKWYYVNLVWIRLLQFILCEVDEMEKCYVCKKKCPCECFEIDSDYGCIYFCSRECYNKSCKEYDWDAEFGQYNDHYAGCELGEHFKEKWKEILKDKKIYQKMMEEKHMILHKIGYYTIDGKDKKPSEIAKAVKELRKL